MAPFFVALHVLPSYVYLLLGAQFSSLLLHSEQSPVFRKEHMHMNHRHYLGSGMWAVALALFLLPGCGGLNTSSEPSRSLQGHVLTVKVGPSDSPEAVAQRYGGEAIVWRPEDGLAVLKVSSVGTASGDVSVLSVSPNITLLAPEALASGYTAANGWNSWAGGWNSWAGGWNSWAGGTGSVFTPTENSNIWSQIRLQQAHALAPNLGRGVKVAVIDTGIDINHPAFVGRLAPSSDWRDFVDGDAYPMEVGQIGDRGYGHGTNVAGIVAQVAPNATILPIRVLNQHGQGNLANVVAAVDWAIQRGAHVINLSLGTSYTASSETTISALVDLVSIAIGQGIHVVASAGNHAQSNLTVPAALSRSFSVFSMGTRVGQLTSVGSVDLNDQRSVFSNFGVNLELMAPGERVFAPAPGGRLAFWSGTSMAAPMVSGAYALALGEAARLSNLGSTGLENQLVRSAVALSSTRNGRRLNVEQFLRKVLR